MPSSPSEFLGEMQGWGVGANTDLVKDLPQQGPSLYQFF